MNQTMSVLVVDEEPAILAGIARMLDSNGVRPLLARSAPEAIEIAKRNYVPIDLILTDVEIPGLSGQELFDQLREVRPELRVLYMSARNDSGVIRIEVMHHMRDAFAGPMLAESVRAAFAAPMVRTSGGAN